MSFIPPETYIDSRARIYPQSTDARPDGPTHVPLSILDASAARFAPTAAVWIYDNTPLTDVLLSSLRKTLDAYPQWCGQLRSTKYNPGGDHTERYGRLVLSYGTDSDPGIEWITAHASCTLFSIIPPPIDNYCDMTRTPIGNLIDGSTQLALLEMVDVPGLPSMIVQFTKFVCGGSSIGIKMAHPLADAQTLLRFATDWGMVCSALVANTPVPAISPVFNPQLLDAASTGDIDSQEPDGNILGRSHLLPLHRYDWWASKKNCIPVMAASCNIPPEITPPSPENFGTPLPWENWDLSVPVSHCIVHFTPNELQNMWIDASLRGNRVSHLDALLAHIWATIIRARGIKDNEECYLDVTFGFRKRLDPPLLSSFIGSPITLAAVASTGREGIAHNIGHMARSIRLTLSKFDSKSLPDLLHEMAFELTPQRRWNTFLGRQNTIATSWLDIGVYDVDFGIGRPKYVDYVMPSADGCVQIMEAGGFQGKDAWYEKGVHVSLHLREDVMSNILKDLRLRQYR